jgi:hypothetical protein
LYKTGNGLKNKPTTCLALDRSPGALGLGLRVVSQADSRSGSPNVGRCQSKIGSNLARQRPWTHCGSAPTGFSEAGARVRESGGVNPLSGL